MKVVSEVSDIPVSSYPHAKKISIMIMLKAVVR